MDSDIMRRQMRDAFILAVDRFRLRVMTMNRRWYEKGQPMFPYINLN